MTAPQKVTKKRLVAYIEPEIYELIENDSISHNCSISKSTEKMLLHSLKEKSSIESQYPIEFQNIELTVLSILSNLPLEIIEKLSEQITSSPIFQGRESSVHAIPAQTGIQYNMPQTHVVVSPSMPEVPEPSDSMIGSMYQDLIPAQTGTDQHSTQTCSECNDHKKELDISEENPNQKIAINNLLPFSLSIDQTISSDSSTGQTQQIAIDLKRYMQDHKLTQRSFKAKYGIDVTKMKNWILGTRSMNLSTIMKILQIIHSSDP
jgi:hypothetical protein